VPEQNTAPDQGVVSREARLLEHDIPLCVDLDGTLIRNDLFYESLVQACKANPWLVFVLPFWLLKGKAYLKRRIAERAPVNAATLPYQTALIEWLSEERANGRRLVLCTGSDLSLAQPVAGHLQLFDDVIANQDLRNLAGALKRDFLVERFGSHGFDYAGNAAVDLDVWGECHHAIVVNATATVLRGAKDVAEVERVFPRSGRATDILRVLRIHQWLKNLLIFLPAIAGHRIADAVILLRDLQMFAAFSLCASGAYILNDLLDLDADRQHATKRHRPFASGSCSTAFGLALIPALTLAGFAMAWPLGVASVWMLAAYLAGTLVYSCVLKSKPLLDVFALSALYTLRVVAGHVATGIAYSPWMLSFCTFIFLSLAFGKRFSELRNLECGHRSSPAPIAAAAGRGYTTTDIQQINIFGIVSGFLAALVLTLYIDSPAVTILYKHPMYLWLLCPVVLYWISRIWFIAGRGELDEDPILFAAKDSVTYWVAGFAAMVMLLASRDWPIL